MHNKQIGRLGAIYRSVLLRVTHTHRGRGGGRPPLVWPSTISIDDDAADAVAFAKFVELIEQRHLK